MLYAAIVRSPYSHATLQNIDISEAMKVPGVRRLLRLAGYDRRIQRG